MLEIHKAIRLDIKPPWLTSVSSHCWRAVYIAPFPSKPVNAQLVTNPTTIGSSTS
ncbi:hypothetical protein KZZ20_06875 [Methylacidiphilum fumariolicum]|uniref:hypothetical protein n=1 Tax=Candidatus Methylacidiphilum fumarolicum TaxID=591154 RepID=UPI00031A183F|nr:hypothetical protein [Candidatus Methylacidiphilum fumarolicum]MBW6415237.1 hypothetical protein [Candidatus Methylacidiphilum fumarolicum]